MRSFWPKGISDANPKCLYSKDGKGQSGVSGGGGQGYGPGLGANIETEQSDLKWVQA